MTDFSYLNVHTHFSRGGGPASPAEWCRRAAQLGYKALAIADRAPLTGLPAFIRAARAEGLTPICGAELDMLLPSESGRKGEPFRAPVLLFARDETGMANLSKLCVIAYAGWPASEAPIEWEMLLRHSAGLVVVLLGEDAEGASSSLVGLPSKKLAELGGALKEHFGDAAFVGLPQAGRPDDNKLAAQVVSVATQMGLPLLAAPSVRYLYAEDALSYTALQLARENAGWPQIQNPKSKIQNSEYLRSPDEAATLYSEWPSAVENVARVVEMCSDVESALCDLWTGAHGSDSESQALGKVAEQRLLSLLGDSVLPEEMRARLNAELHAVGRWGRVQAWLALGSLVDAARANRVPLGAPLGMADSALLSYALGLSSLNPMPYARPSWLLEAQGDARPPLPGIEVPHARRDALIEVLSKEYGSERIAHATCLLDMTPVATAQAALLTLNIEGDDARLFLARVMEKDWAAFDASDPTFDTKQSPLATLALSLQGAPLHFKPDPDIVIIAPASQGDASQVVSFPVLAVNSDSSEGGRWVPWTEEALCRFSYPALSLYPAHALTTLDTALRFAGKYPVPGFSASGIDLSAIPQPSEATTALITKGAVAGIPYISAKVAKGWKGELTAEGMAALVAHSHARHKIRNPKSEIRNLEGDFLYRDQAETLMELAGLSPEDASALRHSLIKPDLDADGALRSPLLDGCMQSGMAEDEASRLRDAFISSGHGLISRHAAHAWGRVALLSATIKASHPAALMTGALMGAWDRGLRIRVTALVAEARRLGVTLLPPDLNKSITSLSLERDGTGWAIRWGLNLLPGWDTARAEQFLAARPTQDISTLCDLALAGVAAGLTIQQLESLALSGACDSLGGQPRDRQALIEALGPMLKWAQGNAPQRGKVDLFTAPISQEQPVAEEATLAHESPSPRARHGYRTWEEANLGVAFTQAAEIDALQQALKGAGDLQSRLLPTSQIGDAHVGKSVFVVGILCGVSLLQSSPDDEGRVNNAGTQGEMPLAVAQVEDLEGSIELVAFPPNYKRHKHLWVEHNLLIVTARVCRHMDGSIYLLCQHMVPFQENTAEEELSLKVKMGRSAARSTDTPSDPASSNGVPKNPLAHTEVIATPKSGAAQPGVNGNYPQSAHSNGNGNSNGHGNSSGNGNGNGHSGTGYTGNGHSAAVNTHTQPATAQATGTPAYRLIISLPFSADDRTDIDTMISLNGILMEHPGPDMVTLRIPYSPEPKAVTYAHLPRGARYNSQLESRLHHLLGPDALAVIKLEG